MAEAGNTGGQGGGDGGGGGCGEGCKEQREVDMSRYVTPLPLGRHMGRVWEDERVGAERAQAGEDGGDGGREGDVTGTMVRGKGGVSLQEDASLSAQATAAKGRGEGGA